MDTFLVPGEIAPFPACSRMEQVEALELLTFALVPFGREFARTVTPVERAAGVVEPHALVINTVTGVRRVYGEALNSNSLKT